MTAIFISIDDGDARVAANPLRDSSTGAIGYCVVSAGQSRM
jgi:hypothetical protein